MSQRTSIFFVFSAVALTALFGVVVLGSSHFRDLSANISPDRSAPKGDAIQKNRSKKTAARKRPSHAIASVPAPSGASVCLVAGQNLLQSKSFREIRTRVLAQPDVTFRVNYLAGVYKSLMGREPEQSRRALWFAALYNRTLTLEDLEKSLLESSEFKNHCAFAIND